MSYDSVDSIIKKWVATRHLTLFTEYKESEVRSVDVVNQRGRRCQLWIDEPDAAGEVGVHVWDYKRKRNDYSVPISRLFACLDEAYDRCQTM